MSKKKRKIYSVNLWIYTDDVKVEIEEFDIKRKSRGCIYTEQGIQFYSYNFEKPSSGTTIGINEVHVSMVTEDFQNIDKVINMMIYEGRKRLDLEISHFNNMHKELNQLEKSNKSIIFNSKEKGLFYIKKKDSSIIMESFVKDRESMTIDSYLKDISK